MKKITSLEQLLELSLKAGAEAAEVYQSLSSSRPVFFEANRLKQLESSQSEGMALRLWKDGCPGLAVAYGEVEASVLVEKAMALTQINPPEIIELVKERTAIYPDTGQVISVEALVETGKKAIATIRDHYPEVICSAEFECEQESTILMNTEGLHCQYTDISANCFLGVEWVRGEDFLGVYDGEDSRDKINPERVISNILQRLAWAEENTSSPLGRKPVLFTPNAATLLWSTIAEALNGKRVMEAASPWSDRLKQLVIAPQLNLSQNPNFGPALCPFDDEGMSTQEFSLINQGTLEQYYTDLTVARALGTTATGNGFRPSLGRYPTPDLVNLIIAPGEHSWEELLKQLEDGVIIDQILGGGADISGDFSVNIDLGYRVKNGTIVGRVKDTMISGNVYQALKKVVALGNDNSWQSSCYTPSIIVEGLSVVSG